MSESPTPAPLWRRLCAAGYDGLLLLGLWMVSVLADVVVTHIAGAARDSTVLRAVLFAVGLVFFGWFWTHGGQTLGMRAWRLQVEHDSGRPLSWISAAARYSAMLLAWGVVLTPLLVQAPHLRDEPHAGVATRACGLLTVVSLIIMRLDRRRRAPQDWLSSTHIVELPAAPKNPSGAAPP